ncbi:MAG: SRPBCC family protein [Pseudomonadota bacterium]
MPQTSQSILIKQPIKNVYATVIDFENYPKIFAETKAAKIIKKGKKTVEVDFVFEVITKINCTLSFTLSPTKISWKMKRGDFMQENFGYWELKEKTKSSTEVTYNLTIKPSMFVPSSVIEGLIEKNTPSMLKNLKKRCERK